MFRFLAIAATASLLIGCEAPQAHAQDEFTDAEREAIESIVYEYILENPEIIEEAVIELQRRAQERERTAQAEALGRFSEAIYEDERDPRLGPADAPIVVVEFMDYKCGYCRQAANWVREVQDAHGDRVQFVFKEYPVLGPESQEAALAALAALRQGDEVYEAFHMAMVGASGALPSTRIDQLAVLAGVDVERMRADMEDPAIAAHLRDVRRLGQSLGVTGTPFFLVDGQVIRGANAQRLDAALASALEG